MNINYSRVTLFLGAFLVLSPGISNAQFRGQNFEFKQEPTLKQQALNIGLNIGINLAFHTASIFYNVFASNGASELYQKMRMGKAVKEKKYTMPSLDSRFIFSTNIHDIVKDIAAVDHNTESEHPENEIDQDRTHYIFYGQPGVGKSSVVPQIAAALDSYYLDYLGTDFANIAESYGLHFTDVLIAEINKVAKKAMKEGKKVIVRIEEIEAIGKRVGPKSKTKNADVISKLNTLIQQLPKNVVLIGTTNHLFELDRAFIQRFSCVKIEPPVAAHRKDILMKFSQSFPISGTGIDYLESLAELTIGFSGRDLSDLVKNAHCEAVRLKNPAIAPCHLESAYAKMVPEIRSQLISEEYSYRRFLRKNGEITHSVLNEEIDKILTNVQDQIAALQNCTSEIQGLRLTDEDDDIVVMPSISRIKKAITQPWYKRYFANSVSFGSYALSSKPALFTYGGLTVGLAAYGLIKTGVLDFTPRLTYQ